MLFFLEFGLRKLRERTYRQRRKTEWLSNGSGEQRDTMAHLFLNRHMHCRGRNIHRYRYRIFVYLEVSIDSALYRCSTFDGRVSNCLATFHGYPYGCRL